MKFKIVENGPWTYDGREDFLSKKVHLVCLAINALTQFNVYATAIGDLSHDSADIFVTKVNEENEVGTLFPKLNLTIVPLSIYKNRNDFGNSEIMRKLINDCFKSNEKYIKCSKLIFAFERVFDFDIDLALEILNEVLSENNFIYTKEIIFYKN